MKLPVANMSIRRIVLAALFLSGVTVHAETMTFQSSDRRTALLELYTSEGCSSCPPAEKWMSALKTSPRLWKDFVPVAFHVDYWDYLGWRDPWSAKQFSDRQRAYAQHWRSESVYTPGFVLDGKEWRNWSGHTDGPSAGTRFVGVLTATSSGTDRWDVTFAAPKAADEKYEVHAALLASGLRSDVKSGENRGRRLDHDFIALSLVDAPLTETNGALRGTIKIKTLGGNNPRPALAVWVTKAGGPEPVQAVGGWLGNLAGAPR